MFVTLTSCVFVMLTSCMFVMLASCMCDACVHVTLTLCVCLRHLPRVFVTLASCVFVCCRDCKIIRDPQTLKSKGYGFVSFVKKEVCFSSILTSDNRAEFDMRDQSETGSKINPIWYRYVVTIFLSVTSN